MTKARDLSNLVSAGQPLADGVIDSTDINGVTASASELNTLDGVTATTAELNYLSGVTSNIQSQFDTINVTTGTLTKSFTENEQAIITLSEAVTPAPVVSVTKEVPQEGFSNGDWNVATDGSNYAIEDTAYAADLTVSTTNSTITLSSGTWASTDVGKRVVGNSGEVYIIAVDGAVATYSVGTDFPNDNTITSGNWSMFALSFAATGLTLSEGEELVGGVAATYAISNAPNLLNTLDVQLFDIVPQDVTFNTDGTKMYIIGRSRDNIYQFTLSTAFDLSTATYDNVSFNVAAQDANAHCFAFSADGTKLFMGGNNQTLYQYSLTTAFDISTMSYDNVSFTTGTTTNSIFGITFNSTGTKLYIAGDFNDSIYQYSLSTAYDLSTITYDSVSFYVGGQGASPCAVLFNADGTKMFTSDYSSDAIFQYSLTTPFAINTASYDSVSFSVATEEGVPFGLAANTDGTKFYIIGYGNDIIAQYSLTTGFDLTTISYDSVFLRVGLAQIPSGISFNNDGTKFYVVGYSPDEVNQYILSTPYDLSTASYDDSISVEAQDGTPVDILFNNDGTKMYIVGQNNASIFQYTLSTAYDVTTASYDSVSFSFAVQDGVIQKAAFNNDGTKLFALGSVGDSVYEYTLSVPFAISSAVYSTSKYIGSQDISPDGLAFSADGMSMFITGDTNNDVFQYRLTTPFSVTTANLSKTYLFDNIDTSPRGITFNGDGTKVYIAGNTTDSVYEFQLGGSYDLGNPAHEYRRFYIGSEDISPQRPAFNTDGTKVYVVGFSTTSVYQYDLATAFDISTSSYNSVSFNVGSQETNPRSVTFNSNGTKMYIIGSVSDSIHQYTLSTAFDVSTASYDSVSLNVGGQDATPFDIKFNDDGTKLFYLGNTTDTIYQYSLTTAFDVSTASYASQSLNAGSQDTTPLGFTFNGDGTKLYVLGGTNNSVFQYTLSSPYTLSGFSYDGVSANLATIDTGWLGIAFDTTGNKLYCTNTNLDGIFEFRLTSPYELRTRYTGKSYYVASQAPSVQDVAFNTDGTKMYVIGFSSDSVHQYSLSTAFDVSTASYDSVSFSVAGQDTSPVGFAFNTNGTKMYMSGGVTDQVYQYTLSTGFDLSTASYDSVSFSVGAQGTSLQNVFFSADGTRMYTVDSGADTIFQYDLSTAFDVSTAAYNSVSLSVSGQEISPAGATFNSDGTRLYLAGTSNDSVFEYRLTSPFNLATASYSNSTISLLSLDSNILSVAFSSDGRSFYVLGNITGRVYQFDATLGSTLTQTPVVPLSQYVAAVTNSTGQIDTQFWSDLNSMTATETLNGANAYYAVANDASTFRVIDNTNGERSIVRNNAGTWEYNSNATYGLETWTAATRNSVYGAFEDAMTVAANQMTGTQLSAITDPNHYTLGSTLDLAIVLYTTDSASNPISDGVAINYDANALNQGAVLGTDYNFDFPSSTQVRITSLAAQNLKIRVV